MLLEESYKKRIQKLAGLQENISLTAEAGRSDVGTISWYMEEYLLKVGSDILNELDVVIEREPGLVASISKSSTNIMSNSLVMKIIIDGTMNGIKVNEEFLVTLSVNIDRDSNTVASIVYRGITNRINLSSKHSNNDLSLFKNEVVESIFNAVTLSTRKSE